MPYGWGRRPLPVTRFLFVAFFALAAFPAAARPAPASEMTVTLLSAGAGMFQVQDSNGRAFSLKTTPATWVLQRGLVVSPRDLTPGETLRVRLGRGKAGTTTALLLCDAETADALDAHRRRPLVGTVVSADARVWTVQPSDGQTPVPICLSAHTTFRAGGSQVGALAFGAGATVAITTRGLANGLLSAVSVSDANRDPPGIGGTGGEPSPRHGSASGVVVDVRADEGLITLQDSAGATRTIAVDAKTRVKMAGQAARLEDIAAGMRVRVWWSAADPASGPVATSISASAPKAPMPKTKRRRGWLE